MTRILALLRFMDSEYIGRPSKDVLADHAREAEYMRPELINEHSKVYECIAVAGLEYALGQSKHFLHSARCHELQRALEGRLVLLAKKPIKEEFEDPQGTILLENGLHMSVYSPYLSGAGRTGIILESMQMSQQSERYLLSQTRSSPQVHWYHSSGVTVGRDLESAQLVGTRS
jgi:hypothetical protein